MWIRALVVVFGITLGVGLCAFVAKQISEIGGRGALGSAFRWGLLPAAVFIAVLPLLAMHGLLRAIAGTFILIANLSLLLFTAGLVIGLWKESRKKGPFVMDRTIALNRPVKKIFSVLLLISIAVCTPYLAAWSGQLILRDLTDFSLSFPGAEPAVKAFLDVYRPAGICGIAAGAASLSLSLFYDWTLGGIIESALTRAAKKN